MTTLKPYHIVNQRHRQGPQFGELRRALMQRVALSGVKGNRLWLFRTHQKK